ALSPILVENLDAVLGRDRVHNLLSRMPPVTTSTAALFRFIAIASICAIARRVGRFATFARAARAPAGRRHRYRHRTRRHGPRRREDISSPTPQSLTVRRRAASRPLRTVLAQTAHRQSATGPPDRNPKVPARGAPPPRRLGPGSSRLRLGAHAPSHRPANTR